MKKIFLAIALTFAIKAVQAQKITVYEVNETFSNGTNPAYSVDIYENSLDDVRSAWKKNMNSYKADRLSGKKQITALKVRMPALSANPVHVYAISQDLGYRHVKLTVAFMVDSIYVNKARASENETCKKLVYDFALQITKQAINNQIKAEQKKQGKMERAYKDLEEDNVSLKKGITEYQNKIKKAESDIEKNIKKTDDKKQEIEKQKELMFSLKDKLEKVQ